MSLGKTGNLMKRQANIFEIEKFLSSSNEFKVFYQSVMGSDDLIPLPGKTETSQFLITEDGGSTTLEMWANTKNGMLYKRDVL